MVMRCIFSDKQLDEHDRLQRELELTCIGTSHCRNLQVRRAWASRLAWGRSIWPPLGGPDVDGTTCPGSRDEVITVA